MTEVDLRQVLRHYDPSQLWFQIGEIVDRRTYLQHGIEVRKGDTVLDVGANVGVAAAFFASHCEAGLVHSFEPVKPVYELLCENLSRFPACIPHNYGLSSTAGTSEITYYPGAAAMSGLYANPERDRLFVRAALLKRGLTDRQADAELAGRYDARVLDCELRTVSAVLGEHSIRRVDLLKIDVERAELDVLAGISDQDWPVIRQIAIEVHDGSGAIAEVTRILADRGYRTDSEQDEEMDGTGVRMLYGVR